MSDVKIPTQFELMFPTLQALKILDGSGHIAEIYEEVVKLQGFSEEQLAVRRGETGLSGIEYRLAWARNGLKNVGAIENSSRGVWSITAYGRGLSEEEALAAVHSWRDELSKGRRERKRGTSEAGSTDVEETDLDQVGSWREELLGRLLGMSPDAFERLAQRLLRESGFKNVEVLGRSGDGGLDGVGIYRVSLVSWPVYFQCKRYRQPVGPGDVRDFRGAMSGRGEKGLLITTASFTQSARDEATRDGAPAVELISGDELCDLLKEHALGVTATERVVEEVEVDTEFFGQFEEQPNRH